MKEIFKCPQCNEIFLDYKSNKRKFCSYKCYWKNLKNRKLSEEHKLKLFAGRKKIYTDKWKEKMRKIIKEIHLGKKRSEQTKLKLRLSHLGKSNWKTPQEHPQWKGGLPKCVDCGKQITYGKIRCRRCCRRGNKHHFWKGGISKLQEYIRRSIESKNWRNNIFNKYNYTCQECGIYNGLGKTIILHPHHIKPFNIIFQEFLQQYSQFSPIEDKETLIRLATTYQPFWDINNGIILCRECHKKKHFKQLSKI